jgi:hypothetical protein
MTNHLTQSIGTAHSGTRILTLLIYTGLVQSTIRILETFRLAIWWFTKVSWLAITHWSWTKHCAYGVRSTWVRHAGSNRWWFPYWLTSTEWVSFVTIKTSTHCSMNCHPALSIESTSTWTRISTFLIDTSLSCGAFSIEHTFRFASHQRVSDIIGIHTITHSSTIQNGANRV